MAECIARFVYIDIFPSSPHLHFSSQQTTTIGNSLDPRQYSEGAVARNQHISSYQLTPTSCSKKQHSAYFRSHGEQVRLIMQRERNNKDGSQEQHVHTRLDKPFSQETIRISKIHQKVRTLSFEAHLTPPPLPERTIP